MNRLRSILLAALLTAAPLAAFATQTPPAPTAQPLSITPAVDDAPTKAKDYDWLARHQAVLDRIKQGKVDLIMVGDSITHIWGGEPHDPGKGQVANDVWEKYLGPRNAVNLGFGWDRTEHVIWRLEHGEVDGIRPKVAVLMIGTNNLGRDSADDVALGIETIVHMLRQKLPRTKILLLGIFPRDHDANSPNRQKIAAVNEKISALGTERGVTYLDIGASFLQPDGTLSKDIMPDFLHPSHRGYEIWAAAMEPTLARLYGDKPRS